MKSLKYVSVVLVITSFLIAQTTENKDAIKKSGDYYYGTGISEVEAEARDYALDELTKQIAVKVSSSFKHKIKESGTAIDENVEYVLKTHASATLKNIHIIKELRDGQIEVFCYIHKTEVKKIFRERIKLIYNLFNKAEDNKADNNISQALKLYYFAGLLLKSIPESNIEYGGINLTTEIPDRINHIFTIP